MFLRLINSKIGRSLFRGFYNLKRVRFLTGFSIRTKLFYILMLFAVAPYFLGMMGRTVYIANSATRSAQSESQDYLKQLNVILDYEIIRIKQQLLYQSQDRELIELLSSDYETMTEFETGRALTRLDNLLTGYVGVQTVLFLDRDIPHTQFFHKGFTVSLVDREDKRKMYDTVLADKRKTVVGGNEGYDGKEDVFSVYRGVYDYSGNLLGVIANYYGIGMLHSTLKWDTEKNIVLASEDGGVVSAPWYMADNTAEVVSALCDGRERLDIDNQTHLIFKTVNEQTGWTVAQLVNYKQTLSNAINMVWTDSIVMLSAILLVILLSFPVAYGISVPILKLVSACRTGGKAPAYNGRDEIAKLYQAYNDMIEQNNEMIDKVYKAEIAQKNAEIESMQAQITPHFLYNTLDTINWMALSAGQKDISKMVRQLANIFRYSLSQTDMLVALSDEIKIVRDYLNIQKVRLRERMNYRIDVSEELGDIKIAKLLIQPIVENSIKHGYGDNDTLNLSVEAKREGSFLYVYITDDGIGVNAEEMNRMLLERDNYNSHGNANVQFAHCSFVR